MGTHVDLTIMGIPEDLLHEFCDARATLFSNFNHQSFHLKTSTVKVQQYQQLVFLSGSTSGWY
jgi:hypothetical protein